MDAFECSWKDLVCLIYTDLAPWMGLALYSVSFFSCDCRTTGVLALAAGAMHLLSRSFLLKVVYGSVFSVGVSARGATFFHRNR